MANSFKVLIGLLLLTLIPLHIVSLYVEQTQTLEVLVIGSPDHDQGPLEYQFFSNYKEYGSVKITFDFQSARTANITSKLLETLDPDVLFLANLFDGDNLMNESEIQAIIGFYGQGKSVVGSHGTLEPYTHAALGPLFGMSADMIADTGGNMPIIGFSQTFELDTNSHPIFMNMPETYYTNSPATLSPTSTGNTWFTGPPVLLDNASLLTRSTDQYGAIFTVENDQSRSVYLSHYPSQFANAEDLILLYNSFVWAGFLESGLTNTRVYTSSSPVSDPLASPPGGSTTIEPVILIGFSLVHGALALVLISVMAYHRLRKYTNLG